MTVIPFPKKPLRFKLVCPHCGSEDVARDAWMTWCFEHQQFEIEDGELVCNANKGCGGEHGEIEEKWVDA